jgi:hypothetical protein
MFVVPHQSRIKAGNKNTQKKGMLMDVLQQCFWTKNTIIVGKTLWILYKLYSSNILWMEEILHQLICGLSHYF